MSIMFFIISLIFALTYLVCSELIIWLTNSGSRTELTTRIESLYRIAKIAMICMLSCSLVTVLFANNADIMVWLKNGFILFLVDTIILLISIFSILLMLIIRTIKKTPFSFSKGGLKSLMVIAFIGVLVSSLFAWLLS